FPGEGIVSGAWSPAVAAPVVLALLGAADTALSTLFDYDAKAPLDLQQKPLETIEGATISDISYASPKGGRVTGYLVTPAGRGPFAGIVFMHWGQGDRSEFLSEAVSAGQKGAVSLLIDAPYRRPGYQYSPAPEAEREMYLQLVVDLRRAVDVLL